MKLGIVLATRRDLAHAAAIALAARRARHEVAMFVMDAGCAALADAPAVVAELALQDCELVVCSNSAAALGRPLGELVLGSQDDHAAVVGTADRVISFT